MSTSRILVVDDEPAIRRGIARVLERRGFDVETAQDGQQAADWLDHDTCDVVVCDISMPRLDGLGLLRHVSLLDLDIPVILITGAPSLESAIQAIEYGAFHYLTKPFDPQELLQTVVRAAHLRRMAALKAQALALSGLPGGRAGDLGALAASFERALDSLWMAYQPILRASDGTVFGYEALMRTDDPGLPHPGAMLDAAERLARLPDLGRAVRQRAVGPMDAGRGMLFINLHPRDLDDEELWSPDAPLSRIAEQTVLEITERASLENVRSVRKRVEALRELGFRIAVDDLGAGYAGLTSFASLQPDFVKFDMSLVRGVDRDPVRQKLIRSMTDLCMEMDIEVVAEGIETPEERDVVVELGCHLLQGFRFGKPGRPFPDVAW
jgi:EAL domain-containing protein (putative c-di-GMP-specific phosphodiesterase class I)